MRIGSDIGKEITELMNRGDLVPGDVSVRLLIQNILQLKKDQISLIDGFPRNQDNIDWWKKEAENDIEVLGVIYLDCSEENMKMRVQGRN